MTLVGPNYNKAPTMEAAVHVSNNTCLKILSFFGVRAHQVSYLLKRWSYPLCFTAWSYVSGSVGYGKGGCHYVTTHYFTDRCHANYKASLVTQIIRPTCNWVAHSKHRPTLEAAVHVSNNACFEILSFFGAGAHQVGYLSKRRSYPLCFTAWSYVSGSVG
ncbi:hypothetical protein PoB_002236900 [Plakobranchus ocellatus]|uniref:Uncharacterized protein n=1 Tax=Plakobranchus ocellatus TaxID=259542 RepID=A0AAV3ZKN0_9GAST|nr:hypothetical protein PoB_002236900 [Plakobranchus ocellatus]